MPLNAHRDASIIGFMLKHNSLAAVLFKTGQWTPGQGPTWRTVVVGPAGQVSETAMGKADDDTPGVWVREYDATRADHINGKTKFFKFDAIFAVRILQPSEFAQVLKSDAALDSAHRGLADLMGGDNAKVG